EIVQTTGEDWADVALAVSTVRTAQGGSAPDLRPLIVRYPAPVAPPRPVANMRVDQSWAPGAMGAVPPEMASRGLDQVRPKQAAEEQQAVLDTNGFQAVFRIPGR